MRHFLRVAGPPGAASRRVATRPTVALLIALAGATQGFAPALARAALGTVAVAAIASAADAHLLGATGAAIQPIRVLACLHVSPHAALDNAAFCGHKGNCNAPSHARFVRRPGVPSRNLPGPSSIRRLHSRIAHSAVLGSSLTSRAWAQQQSTIDLIRRRRLPRARIELEAPIHPATSGERF